MPNKPIQKKEQEKLEKLSEETAVANIEEAESVAEKVVDGDPDVRSKEDSDIPDDVVAESAERRKRAANSPEEVAAIEEAESVRLTTEATLPDTPTDLVTVVTSDAKALNFPRSLNGVNGIKFVDGKAQVTPEQAAELKQHYPTLITIL